jgi:polar amino acid transport system substrate-binding protein
MNAGRWRRPGVGIVARLAAPVLPAAAAALLASATASSTPAATAEAAPAAAAAAAGPLRFGADAQGGAPYVFYAADDPTRLTGFEIEIVAAIAQRLGRTPALVQNDWENLVPGLLKGDYELAVGGIEITDDRKEVVRFSEPYYVTFVQLAVREGDTRIRALDDCKGKRVGALKQSLAVRYLEEVGDVEVREYNAEVDGYTDMLLGRVDAMLCDAPVAVYYGTTRPGIELVGAPVGRMEYGIPIAKGNPALLAQVNAALAAIKQDGRLREILDRWNLWNPLMADLLGDRGPPRSAPTAFDEFLATLDHDLTLADRLARYVTFLPLLGRAAVTTLVISILSMSLAVVVGGILALVRVYGAAPLSALATLYIEFVRGTPLLIQLFFIYYGLPNLGIELSPFVAGLLGLGLNYAAYEAENYRAGLLSVPPGQMEAARALALSHRQALRHVVMPQAFRLVLPPMTNDFISLLKDSSLVSLITMVELTKAYTQLATTYYDYFGLGILTALIYLLLGLPFVRLARWAERSLETGAAKVRAAR